MPTVLQPSAANQKQPKHPASGGWVYILLSHSNKEKSTFNAQDMNNPQRYQYLAYAASASYWYRCNLTQSFVNRKGAGSRLDNIGCHWCTLPGGCSSSPPRSVPLESPGGGTGRGRIDVCPGKSGDTRKALAWQSHLGTGTLPEQPWALQAGKI